MITSEEVRRQAAALSKGIRLASNAPKGNPDQDKVRAVEQQVAVVAGCPPGCGTSRGVRWGHFNREKAHMTNFVQKMNQQIHDFATDERRSRDLQAATGSYCTPFRGKLFGHESAGAVAAELGTGRRARVLFLGSNPNVPRCLNLIGSGYDKPGEWNYFLDQMESSLFAAMNPEDPANPSPGWDPIHEPRGAWKFFAEEVLKKVSPLDDVAMMNAVPWGSADFDTFLRTLREKHPDLLDDILAFSEKLLFQALQALKPRVLLAPFSFVDNKLLDGIRTFPVALSRADDVEVRQKPFRIVRATVRWDGLEVPMICIGHPSALRYQSAESKKGIARDLVGALMAALEQD